jgi:hypothetical protein
MKEGQNQEIAGRVLEVAENSWLAKDECGSGGVVWCGEM